MTFWQIWQKIKTAAILAWFSRNGSNLKIKLLYVRALDIVYFRHYMYFAIAIIRLNKITFLIKNRKFETLYLEKHLCDKSEFFRGNKPEAIFSNAGKLSLLNVLLFEKSIREKDFF